MSNNMADNGSGKMVKARKQISQAIGPKRGGDLRGNYNIWYNKHPGERYDSKEKQSSSSRCYISKDEGETRGNARDGAYTCLKFARGCCPLGYECPWLHLLPTGEFNANLDATRDCFGRERHDEVREDQSGVGSFATDLETARTLYVGGIASPRSNIQSTVRRHFTEWGEIENVRVLESKGVAFVRYKYRANAEFAKEAMQKQSLDNGEFLNIRWATADPNPWVAKRKLEENKRALGKAVIESLPKDGPWMGYYGGPPKKRHQGVTRIKGQAVEVYPDTDHQYREQELAINSSSVCQVSEDRVVGHIQPKTLLDLVKWSEEQASLGNSSSGPNENVQANTQSPNNAKALTSLVSAYSSSSEEEEEES